MNQLSRPFLIKPPTHVPELDTSVQVTSTASDDPVTRPNRVLHVGTRPDVSTAPAPAVASAAEPMEPHLTEAEQTAAPIADAVPGSGSNRDSYFSRFMAKFAEDSSNAVDPAILQALNMWFSRVIVTHTTAETVIRDFGNAMTEQGVQIDARLPQLEKFVQELIWIRNMRELLHTLTLADYEDVILAREIYQEFGKASEIEGEIAKSKARRFDLENFLVTSMTSIAKGIADIRSAQVAPKPAGASPFRPQPAARTPGAPLRASAPTPPVAPPADA